MKDLKILNGKIPDFETGTWKTADLLIHQGTITKIGTVCEDTEKTIDAGGKIVSPGFIDIHSHEDPITEGPYRYLAALCQLRMGVTTAAAGNCGENYNNIGDFICYVNRFGSPVNYLMFVGQHNLRQLSDAENRYLPSSRVQLEKQKKLLQEALSYEPIGLSCGFEYSPGITTAETIDLLSVLEGDDYLTSVHFRQDGEGSLQSIDELVEITKKSGIPMQMSHIGSCSATGFMDGSLKKLRQVRDRGIDITSDCYPYAAFCTNIGTTVFDEGCFEKWGKSYDAILITGGEFKNQRCTREIFEKVRRETPSMPVVAFVMNEEEVITACQEPFVMIGSDCGFEMGSGHPRSAGTFPRVFSRYVREKKVLTLMDALKKMTVQPAKRLQLAFKGEIKEGFDADLVIFDENTITDHADFENPALPPSGIDYVIVSGTVAAEKNNLLSTSAGRYIPRSQRKQPSHK